MRALLLAVGMLVLTPVVAAADVAEGEVAVRSVSTGQCLTRPLEEGVVYGDACAPLDRQAWQLTVHDDSSVAITAAGTGLCLAHVDLDVISTPCDDLAELQVWRLIEQDGSFHIQATKDDAGLDWCLWHADDSQYVGLQPCAGTVDGERWQFPPFQN
ncbi:RICIN domain-containing protein [Actinokineospora globicatena]|uniref:Ricin-type beta-trefoil lectin domain-containing protein n=1 Tax=Actinokineospora globicatena TaxID=103729 RepID=A0A9W6VBT4_9PSEU|nr:hypothetical protein [Actinokineospora globicatena]GLW93501.1 hypothetical protein Aglo03_43170 [Actinokineospora globicatena]